MWIVRSASLIIRMSRAYVSSPPATSATRLPWVGGGTQFARRTCSATSSKSSRRKPGCDRYTRSFRLANRRSFRPPNIR